MVYEGPYKIGYGSDSKYYVDGPAPGGEFSYYGGTLYSSLRMRDEEEAERAVKVANIAYAEGYKRAQRDIKKALGVG